MQPLPQNINSDQVKSTEALTLLMRKVLEFAQQQGATEASVSASHDSGFSIDVRMGEVETIAFSEDKGISTTVYMGQRKGSASSTDTSDAALEAMVIAASEIAKVSAADPCFGLPNRELINNHYPDLALFSPWKIAPAQAIEMALACEKKALSVDSRISNSDGVNISTYSFCHGYANSFGCEGVVNSSRHNLSCSLIAKEGDSMQRDYDYTTARRCEDLMSLEVLAQTAAERVISRLGAKKIKTQKAPVVFSSRISSSLCSSFIGAISGSNIYRKHSFLLDALGKSVFPQFIHMYEQPHLLRGLGSSPFDGEGVPTRANIFVKEGILSQYALSTYSARRLGLETTANSGGVFNLTVDPTVSGLEEILKMMGKGLLVTELMGQGVNILTGDYSRGASGFWVEEGEIQYPVEEITIAGNLKDIFLNILAVGQDINPNSSTRCGSILIEEMMIAGN